VEGRVRDVIYLGVHTRYLVELDSGEDLTVVEQNRETTSMDVLVARGRPVRLEWHPTHNRRVGTAE
jgi:ABC-type Fe3+/spermidine/putrescine transport system ATPase subunit